MKKFKLIITVAVLAVISYSCNNSAVERMVDKMQPEPVVIEQEGAGFFTPQPGVKYVVGSDDVMDVWKKYIDAHNNRDLELIASMNIDSTDLGNFRILSPNGQIILGSDTQIEFLKGWFEAENPKWKTNFSFSMRVEGQKGEWVITGSEVKKTVDGEEVTTYDVADVYIEDGKIGAFWVYSRAAVPVE